MAVGTHPATHRQTGSPGAGFVPRWAIVLLCIGSLLSTLLVLYSLWAFWPRTDLPKGVREQDVSWFGWENRLSTEFLFFLAVALAGALGGLIHTLRSFTWYAGNRNLRLSWLPFNLMLPVVGALGGTVFYLVLRAGLFTPSTQASGASPFGFAAVAVLAGLFSEQALEKLRQVASNVFAEPPTGADHVESK
jgi:hypothetical protein